MKVEIWADVVCPWCYIGKRRFESALAGFEHRDEVEVDHRSFELDPSAPATTDVALDERLSAKYGVPIEQARAMNERVERLAAAEGLDYRLDIAQPANSFDAHRVAHLAARSGRRIEMVERLYRAYFGEGRVISDHATLAELAADVGLDRPETEAMLATDRFADDVRADERLAAGLGITAVPFFVIDRRYGVPGAHDAATMLQVLRAAWADRSPVAGPTA